MSVDIRPMTRDDVDRVVEIERACFAAPWPRQVFCEELGRSWAHLDVLRQKAGGAIVAFVNYWIVGDEVHILNLATHPEQRRCGWAARLLDHVTGAARGQASRLVSLEVRRSNVAAIRLYRRHGFRAVAVRAGYYADNGEDAVVMLLELEEAP